MARKQIEKNLKVFLSFGVISVDLFEKSLKIFRLLEGHKNACLAIFTKRQDVAHLSHV